MFVRSYDPIWYFTDLTGLPLNDRYYIFFKENTVPYLPQAVYQDPDGNTPWSNPIQFQPSGTLPNNIYFDPTLVYRIEIRKGSTDSDPLIWLIENYVPSTGNSVSAAGTFVNAINLVTNPQFADIDFVSPLTFTKGSSNTYTIDVGPGWQLVLVGTGTTVLTQVAIPGDTWPTSVPGNAPYALQINNNGWTSASLIQTFSNNGEIFANGAISMSVTAVATGSSQQISLSYVPSGISNPTEVLPATTVGTGAYAVFGNSVPVQSSQNSNTGSLATVQMVISLPETGIVNITNVQFIGQASNLLPSPAPVPAFQEISYERVVDQEFHLYKQSLLNEPKNSLLVGWNFANNPWQFTSTTPANVATNKYTADQTIIIQQNYVDTGAGNNISVGQDSVANNYGLKITAVTAANQFAVLQYIGPATIRQYWGGVLSSMVKAFITPTHLTSVGVKMRLIYKAGLPGTLSRTDPIASWAVNGDPVAAAGYTLITPPNDPTYTLTSTPTYYSFNGMALPASSSTDMTLGILLYTNGSMNQAATADFITINDISLVNNDFALPTQPETFDETLRKCQYYYEKSYDIGTLPAVATPNSALAFIQTATSGGGGTEFWPNYFTINFKVIKRASPNAITIYSPSTGASGNISAVAYSTAYTSSTTADYGMSNFNSSISGVAAAYYTPGGGASPGPACGGTTIPQIGSMRLHYTVNACLGNPTLP